MILMFLLPMAAFANDSAYTKLNLDRDCTFYESNQQGGSAQCAGYKQYPIFFSEGDLRQTVRFGFVDRQSDRWETFSQFNQVNVTVEWRLDNGKPFATILRWFIENDGSTGSKRGQVLVVSTVAGDHNSESCIAGYVDARANKDANVLARRVADEIAINFVCGSDLPRFHGIRGGTSGNPTVVAE